MITVEPTVGRVRSPWIALGGWLLVATALSLAFGHNFHEMWLRWFPAWTRTDLGLYDRFVEGESYYTHGPLVPLVSLLITVLLIRHTKMPVRPRADVGVPVMLAAALLHLSACLARVNFASGFAFIGVLVGLVLTFWGATALRRLWFPVVLLLFMVPLPEVSIAQLNFRLKMFAAEWGVKLANVVGVLAERNGNQVFLAEGKTLVIANVCNGLRTIISLLAFGALYAYVCRLRGLWRLGLFAMTIPVAVVSNSVRILSLIVVAHFWTPETATGWYHDFSGLLIFVLAFLLMFSIERFILWARGAAGRPAKVLPLFHGQLRSDEDEGQWSRMGWALGTVRGYVIGAILIVVAGGAIVLNRTVPSSPSAGMVAGAAPSRLTILGKWYDSYPMTLDRNTLTVLENPSYAFRRYVAAGEAPVDFCVIFSKDNRKGTHPPDLCLEGGGEGIVAKADVEVAYADDRPSVPCKELITQSGTRRVYFAYTYKCGGQYTRSFWKQQFVIFKNGLLSRNASGALIRVSSPAAGSVDEARQRCLSALEAALPHLDENLP